MWSTPPDQLAARNLWARRLTNPLPIFSLSSFRSETKREGFLCQVCQVVMNSYSQLLQHLNGAKHKAQAEAAALTSDGVNDDDAGNASHFGDAGDAAAHHLGVPATSDGASPARSWGAHLGGSPNAQHSPAAGASHSPRGATMHRRPLSAPGSPRLGLVSQPRRDGLLRLPSHPCHAALTT